MAEVPTEQTSYRELGMRLPSGTVTFLLTDVEASTAAKLAMPDEAEAALGRIDESIDDVARVHGGVRPIEQGEGDSAVVAFTSAADGVRAAAALQEALACEPIRVRAAVHTGEAHASGGRYAGLALNRCARLRDVAHGGQVLVSRATYELVRDEIVLIELGTHRLRDLGRPEHVYQLDLGEAFPPLRSLDEIPNNLPAHVTSFVGRTNELDEIATLLAAHRVVTIVGSGGCGKSRLALQTAARSADTFADGVWWVDLSGVTDASVVASAIRAALRVRDDADDALARHVRERCLLVVLDNCEHLLEETSAVARLLVDAGPDGRVLTTTREPLAVPGEAAWRVPSMSAPDAEELFAQRARLVRTGFTVDDQVPTICSRLDGIPLAIELAAARVRAMSTKEIAVGLDDRFRLLTGGPRGVAARQRTLEASVDWSHDLLTEDERVVFRRLAVFAGGFSREGAEAIVVGDVLDVLTTLVDRSLVTSEEFEDGTRYRMLETIRQYAYERLKAAEETIDVRNRHLAYYLALCERAWPELDTATGQRWMPLLDAEYDNIRAALEWSASSPDDDSWVRIVATLGPYWVRQSFYAEALAWTKRALEATQSERSARRLELLRADGWLAGSVPDLARHAADVAEGIELARDLGHRRLLGRFLSMRAYALVFGDPAVAREAFREPLEIAVEEDDDFGIAFCNLMIAATFQVRDRYDEALALFDAAEPAIERTGDLQLRNFDIIGRAWIAHRRGDLRTAIAFAEHGMELASQDANPLTRSGAVAGYGWVLARMGRTDEACELLAARIREAEEAGLALAIPLLWGAVADVFIWAGRIDEIVGILDRYVPLYAALGDGWGVVLPLTALGDVLSRTTDRERAGQVLREALDASTRLDFPTSRARALSALARLSDDPSVAEDLEHEALDIRRTFGMAVEIPASLEALARLAAEHGSEDESARLLAAALTERERMGSPVPPVDRPAVDELVGRLRGTTAWSEGEALSIDETVAYATRARGTRGRPSTGWESLTPTELDVVRWATDGLTNPEIGAKLFMSRATVKAHLSRVYVKLGISSRTELAAEAARRGLASATN